MIGTCIGINDKAGINAKKTSYLGLTQNQRIGQFLPKLCKPLSLLAVIQRTKILITQL